LAEEFCDQAGPEVQYVGLLAGVSALVAPLPCPTGRSAGWGRALGRETLDTLLIERARAAGAVILQPYTVRALHREGHFYRSVVEDRQGRRDVLSRIVIAAHGSWESGRLPTQPAPTAPRPDQLLGFKAHFVNSDLPVGRMPLLVFPGGYGGMVHSDGGRVSLSCCVRRDRLAVLRADHRTETAGEVVLEHILDSCRGVRRALRRARREGPWLAAGPLRTGIRVRANGGLFAVGNAAGEAHPVIAEGISMAMQSSWLLAARLIAHGPQGTDWHAVGADYARAWRRAFSPRLRAAAVFAHWAMRPAAVATVVPLMRVFPAVLNWGARLSGKATQVVD
jgi:flavin-dependent dehydrogenase